MKTAYHEFYKDFKCIADKCPDSCCKEWDVVVDDDSYIKYKKRRRGIRRKTKKCNDD